MSRLILLATAIVGGWLTAAPIPTDARDLVAKLSDPSAKVRDEATAALRDRPETLPWLRRAARSADTARRAVALMTPHETKRQAVVAQAIETCIREGRADLFTEWHHYWQPESKDDLWPVGPRMIQAGKDEYVKWVPPNVVKRFQADPESTLKLEPKFHDGPLAQLAGRQPTRASWRIRTDLWWRPTGRLNYVAFASVAGPAWVERGEGHFFVLGSVQAHPPQMTAFIVCDGDFWNGGSYRGEFTQDWGQTSRSFIACRGDIRGASVVESVLLVDGDVELFDDGGCTLQDSMIRASGEISIPENAKIVNSKIEPHAKNATAPYKFFELADVGLSLADDEEGLVVRDVKADTPFGNSGIGKGDLILAIDDAPAGHSEVFRKLVRRAMVRQGNCLLTVARGKKTVDLAVHFPLPR